ncbi:MAG TPA: hypothetical protein VF041_23325 [Gemmatimonadaceae bacterium]
MPTGATLPRLDRPPTADERPFAPHGAQKTIIASRAPELIVVGPADTGKTRTIFEKIHRALECYPGARALYCRKERTSCTDTGLVTFEERVLPPGHYLKAGPKRDGRHSYKYANGSELVVGGLDDLEKHRSSEYDWIYVQECSEATEDDWENLLRATTGRAGVLPYPQLIGDMNPEHPLHWAHRRCDEGRALEVYVGHEDNPSVTSDRLAALARMTGPRRERFFLGRRVVDTEGSYYGKLLYEAREAGRVGPIPIDPTLRVHTSWDFGVSDFTTIWFWQASGRQRWAVDYFEQSGEGLEYYAGVITRKAQRYRYILGDFYLPHDVEARLQAMQADTRLDLLRRLFPNNRMVVVPRVTDVAARIQASRDLIPVTWFDDSRAPVDDAEARNTAQGMQRLLMYKREYNEALGTYAARPKHDQASHAADSFGAFAQGFTEAPKLRREEPQRLRIMDMGRGW